MKITTVEEFHKWLRSNGYMETIRGYKTNYGGAITIYPDPTEEELESVVLPRLAKAYAGGSVWDGLTTEEQNNEIISDYMFSIAIDSWG